MRITPRDFSLLRDVALSHVLSRDQVLELGYFSSITRANFRLRQLERAGLLTRLKTPFYSQSLYAIGRDSSVYLGEKVSKVVSGRLGTPRFIQHALCTTNVRLRLLRGGATGWRFEQQLWSTCKYGGRTFEVRPDGLAIFTDKLVAVEVDLGHASPSKVAQKLLGYQAFQASGEVVRAWNVPSFSLLVVTTGTLRATRLTRLVPSQREFQYECKTFNELNIACPGAWS